MLAGTELNDVAIVDEDLTHVFDEFNVDLCISVPWVDSQIVGDPMLGPLKSTMLLDLQGAAANIQIHVDTRLNSIELPPLAEAIWKWCKPVSSPKFSRF